MLLQQAKHQGKRSAPEEAYARYIQRSISPSLGLPMDVPSYYRGRRRGERSLSPARFCSALGPCADFVPAIADGVFEAFPGAGVTRFPVAAGVDFQRGPVATTVTLICAQLVAVAVRGLILRISGALASNPVV